MELRENFSWRWAAASFVIFLGIELLLGGVAARVIAGRFVGHVALLKIEALMILASYFAGGFLIALISPSVRVLEPGLGAAASVAVTFSIAVFSPLLLFGLGLPRLIIGCLAAFGLAWAGARSGERWAGRLGNDASKAYSG